MALCGVLAVYAGVSIVRNGPLFFIDLAMVVCNAILVCTLVFYGPTLGPIRLHGVLRITRLLLVVKLATNFTVSKPPTDLISHLKTVLPEDQLEDCLKIIEPENPYSSCIMKFPDITAQTYPQYML